MLLLHNELTIHGPISAIQINAEADRIDTIGGVNSPQGEVLYRECGIAASPQGFAPKSRGRCEILDRQKTVLCNVVD